MGVTNYKGYYLFTKGDDPPSKNIKKRPKRIVLTVDGSKIQRSPVEVGSLSIIYTSQVVQDSFQHNRISVIVCQVAVKILDYSIPYCL